MPELEKSAQQVVYEVKTLFGQVEALYSGGFARRHPVHLALVEASLVHLRLLDEFCFRQQTTQKHLDVFARQYLPTWTSDGFLDAETRSAINAQVQHLPERRVSGYQWPFGDLVRSCSNELMRFIDELHVVSPDRAAWFSPCVEAVAWIERRLEEDLNPEGS